MKYRETKGNQQKSYEIQGDQWERMQCFDRSPLHPLWCGVGVVLGGWGSVLISSIQTFVNLYQISLETHGNPCVH